MSELVVDTNVWVLADRITSISGDTPAVEADCIEACYRWIQQFAEGNDSLVVDRSYRIFREYRLNISIGGLSEQILNRSRAFRWSAWCLSTLNSIETDMRLCHESLLRMSPTESSIERSRLLRTLRANIQCDWTDWTEEKGKTFLSSDLLFTNSARITLSRECSSARFIRARSPPTVENRQPTAPATARRR